VPGVAPGSLLEFKADLRDRACLLLDGLGNDCPDVIQFGEPVGGVGHGTSDPREPDRASAIAGWHALGAVNPDELHALPLNR